jgi:hypothetical protein
LSQLGYWTDFLLENNQDRKRDLNPYPGVTKRFFTPFPSCAGTAERLGADSGAA